MKILMVCLGNICRSPLADALLRKKLESHNLNHQVDSAGTSAFHLDSEPDLRTQANALEHNLDISYIRARKFVTSDFDEFDQIYAMDSSNYYNIVQLARNDDDRKKVDLLLNKIPSLSSKDVPDPYYGGEQGFEVVYQLIDQATDVIIEELKKHEN